MDRPNASAARCDRLLVVGAGVMGNGVARLFAGSGIDVTLMDTRVVPQPHPSVNVVRELPRDGDARIWSSRRCSRIAR